MLRCPRCGSDRCHSIGFALFRCDNQLLVGVERSPFNPAGIPIYRPCGMQFEDFTEVVAAKLDHSCHECGGHAFAYCACHSISVCRRHCVVHRDAVYCRSGAEERRPAWAAEEARLAEARERSRIQREAEVAAEKLALQEAQRHAAVEAAQLAQDAHSELVASNPHRMEPQSTALRNYRSSRYHAQSLGAVMARELDEETGTAKFVAQMATLLLVPSFPISWFLAASDVREYLFPIAALPLTLAWFGYVVKRRSVLRARRKYSTALSGLGCGKGPRECKYGCYDPVTP